MHVVQWYRSLPSRECDAISSGLANRRPRRAGSALRTAGALLARAIAGRRGAKTPAGTALSPGAWLRVQLGAAQSFSEICACRACHPQATILETVCPDPAARCAAEDVSRSQWRSGPKRAHASLSDTLRDLVCAPHSVAGRTRRCRGRRLSTQTASAPACDRRGRAPRPSPALPLTARRLALPGRCRLLCSVVRRRHPRLRRTAAVRRHGASCSELHVPRVRCARASPCLSLVSSVCPAAGYTASFDREIPPGTRPAGALVADSRDWQIGKPVVPIKPSPVVNCLAGARGAEQTA